MGKYIKKEIKHELNIETPKNTSK